MRQETAKPNTRHDTTHDKIQDTLRRREYQWINRERDTIFVHLCVYECVERQLTDDENAEVTHGWGVRLQPQVARLHPDVS
jgi:hypothetical protein